MVLGKLPVPGRPTIWIIVGHWFGHFFSHLSFLFSYSLSLGNGTIETEILSQRDVRPKSTNQPT